MIHIFLSTLKRGHAFKTKSFHHHEMLQNGENSLDIKQNKATTREEENWGISSR